MPITRARKEEVVGTLTDLFARSESAVLVDHGGLTVAQLSSIRRRLRDAGSPFMVAKNRLIQLALQNNGRDMTAADGTDLACLLKGMTAIAFGFEQPNLPAKMLEEMAGEFPALGLKGGFYGTRPVAGLEGVKLIAGMRSKDDVLGELLYMVNPSNALRHVLTVAAGAPRRVITVASGTSRVLQQVKMLKETEAA